MLPLHENPKRILLGYIEPTPYILGLINELTLHSKNHIDIFFLNENVSQNWNMTLDHRWQVFPKNFIEKIKFIKKIFKKPRYDMIHVAGWGEPWFILLILIAKFFKIPVVVESDMSMPFYTKLWKRMIKRLVYPSLFRLINLFFSGGTRQTKYIQHYGVDSTRIIPMQMTVDITSIRQYASQLTPSDHQKIRERYHIPAENTVYLFAGRLEKHKGIEDLISAFMQITNKTITLLIAGSGSAHDEITHIATQQKNICYAGRLSNKELIEAYYAADVVVLPSHFEPWGLVINEAMAVGRPVLVSDRVGCIDDLVFQNETGFIFKAGCIADLKNSIEYMAHVQDERIRMGKNAERIIENWTLENEAKIICQGWHQFVQQ